MRARWKVIASGFAYQTACKGRSILSHLAGRGVFQSRNNEAFFRQMRVGGSGEPAWSDDIAICPGSLYLRLIDKSADDVLRNPAPFSSDA